ncbi:MAG: RNA polymerase sigma factor [Desulfocapsaceae bacterium]|nr:RNA polymerase sigma factor [Desulfocapsaceae bacterium]
MLDSDQQNDCILEAASGNDVIMIVEKAREGNREAFERLVGIFQDEVFRMIYYRTRSRFDAEDLTQEVCLRAYKNIRRLKDGDRFRSWLFGIAVNCVHDFHRKRQFFSLFDIFGGDNTAEKESDGPDSTPTVRLENTEFWQHINTLSSRLSRLEREVFFLRFMDHLSIKEISQALNKNESTVKTHLYRALKKFKEDSALIEMIQGGLE